MEWYTETLVIIIVFVICDDDRNFSDWFCIFLLAIDVYVFGTLVWIRLRDKSSINNKHAMFMTHLFQLVFLSVFMFACLSENEQ
jgi:Trk-type K+ transport system membrane component